MSAYTTEILDMKLGGMVCPSCEDVIAAALLAERGVVDAEVSRITAAAHIASAATPPSPPPTP